MELVEDCNAQLFSSTELDRSNLEKILNYLKSQEKLKRI